jgi:hypothetical protein
MPPVNSSLKGVHPKSLYNFKCIYVVFNFFFSIHSVLEKFVTIFVGINNQKNTHTLHGFRFFYT